MPPVAEPMRPFSLTSRSLLILAVSCGLLFAAVTLLIMAGMTAGFDRAGLLIWRGGTLPSAFMLESVRDLTALGGVVLRNSFAIGAALALILLHHRKRASWLVLTVASGWGLNTCAKWLVYRPRPDFLPHWTDAMGPSFPSGHSFNGAVVYLSLGLIVAGLSQSAALQRFALLTAIAVSLLIAWSRVWLGVHYPTDVIAGWLGGAGWACLSAAVASGWLTDGRSRPAA